MAIASRAIFFNFHVLDWDESTFILIAQDLLDGHLPYTRLWDIKPPALYYFFAGIIGVFGRSLIAIRSVGAMLVFMIGILVFESLHLIGRKNSALVAALLTVLLNSRYQHLSSELIAVPFFLLAFFLLIRKPWNWISLVVSGILVGFACLVRLNLLYTGFAVGVYIIIRSVMTENWKKGVLNAVAFGGGVFLSALVISSPYLLTGQFRLLYTSVIEASLNLSGNNRGMFYALLHQGKGIVLDIAEFPAFLLFVVGFILVLRKRLWRRPVVILLLVILVSTEISILRTGISFPHYTIQLIPYVVILTFIGLKDFNWKKAMTIAICILCLLVVNVVVKYRETVVMHNESRLVQKYIKDNELQDESIVLFKYHILHWLLDIDLSRPSLTHPSTVMKPGFLKYVPGAEDSFQEEIDAVMGANPEFAVMHPRYFRQTLQDYMERDYTRISDLSDILAFRRNHE